MNAPFFSNLYISNIEAWGLAHMGSIMIPVTLWTLVRRHCESPWFLWRIELQQRTVAGTTPKWRPKFRKKRM